MTAAAKPKRYWGGISAYQGARLPEVARRLEAEGCYAHRPLGSGDRALRAGGSIVSRRA